MFDWKTHRSKHEGNAHLRAILIFECLNLPAFYFNKIELEVFAYILIIMAFQKHHSHIMETHCLFEIENVLYSKRSTVKTEVVTVLKCSCRQSI